MESADRMIWIVIPVLLRGKAIPIVAACCANGNFESCRKTKVSRSSCFVIIILKGGGVAHKPPRPCRGEEASIMIMMGRNQSLSRQFYSFAILC